MDRFSELYFVHNIWGELEIKIPDIIMISLNIFMVLVCLVLWIAYLLIKFNDKKTDVIQVGPLCHLCKYILFLFLLIFEFS